MPGKFPLVKAWRPETVTYQAELITHDGALRGEDGVMIPSWQLDREKFRMSPLMNNGTVGPNQGFRGMFEQFLCELSRAGYFDRS